MREEMQDGALGIGTALIYPPGNFATTDELIAVCGPVGEYDGIYISHMRSEGDEFLECLDELLDDRRRAGCRAEVYHLKAAGRRNWPKMAAAIERIQAARDAGRPVGANMYPTPPAARPSPPASRLGSTTVGRRLSRAAWPTPPYAREMAAAISTESGGGYENLFLAASEGEGILFISHLSDGTPARGLHLSELARDLGLAPADALLELVARDPETSVAYFLMSEENIELGLSQPWVSLGSDAAAHSAVPPHTEQTDPPAHVRHVRTVPRPLRARPGCCRLRRRRTPPRPHCPATASGSATAGGWSRARTPTSWCSTPPPSRDHATYDGPAPVRDRHPSRRRSTASRSSTTGSCWMPVPDAGCGAALRPRPGTPAGARPRRSPRPRSSTGSATCDRPSSGSGPGR